MYEKVVAVLADVLSISADKIKPESNIAEDLGADSLDRLELLSRLEEEADVTLPEEDIEGLVTVADVVAELQKLMK